MASVQAPSLNQAITVTVYKLKWPANESHTERRKLWID